MSWTAIVPIKGGAKSKSRLSARFSCAQRVAINEAMAAHVLGCLRAASAVSEILVLGPTPPREEGVAWRKDTGRGLNAELGATAALLSGKSILVVHADLPLLTSTEVEAMVHAAALCGAAIAPDKHGQGTNALALTRYTQDFAFGPQSFSQHRAGLAASAAVIESAGLAWDLDTVDDFDLIAARVSGQGNAERDMRRQNIFSALGKL